MTVAELIDELRQYRSEFQVYVDVTEDYDKGRTFIPVVSTDAFVDVDEPRDKAILLISFIPLKEKT